MTRPQLGHRGPSSANPRLDWGRTIRALMPKRVILEEAIGICRPWSPAQKQNVKHPLVQNYEAA